MSDDVCGCILDRADQDRLGSAIAALPKGPYATLVDPDLGPTGFRMRPDGTLYLGVTAMAILKLFLTSNDVDVTERERLYLERN